MLILMLKIYPCQLEGNLDYSIKAYSHWFFFLTLTKELVLCASVSKLLFFQPSPHFD